jgi:alkaline phosphatase
MAKNVILMIGDGMGWEMSRASAIQKQIEQEIAQIRTENPQITNKQIAARFDGRTLNDYYVAGKGTGTSYQNLSGYTIATTSNTYIDGNKSNSALQNNPNLPPNVFHHNTGQAKPRQGFEFDPNGAKVQGFVKSATTPQIEVKQYMDAGFNEAPVLDDTGKMLGGNMPIFDREQGGQTISKTFIQILLVRQRVFILG